MCALQIFLNGRNCRSYKAFTGLKNRESWCRSPVNSSTFCLLFFLKVCKLKPIDEQPPKSFLFRPSFHSWATRLTVNLTAMFGVFMTSSEPVLLWTNSNCRWTHLVRSRTTRIEMSQRLTNELTAKKIYCPKRRHHRRARGRNSPSLLVLL